jgi:benzoyl-CoA reductase/2-hydroxyglutaryl-CoA dehydratase subunit BcrC/BadD/HgdB
MEIINVKQSKRALKTSYEAANILRNYWSDIHKAKRQGRPIAWASGVVPTELLYTFDILPAYPENYGAVCASKDLALPLCQMAVARGFSTDLCSYALINFGDIYWEGPGKPEMPFGGLPTPPDILITTRIPCLVQIKWWEIIKDRYNCPMIVLDAPMTDGEATDDQIDYVAAQLKEMISQLEDFTHTKLDEDKFMKALALSDEASAYWHEITDLRGSVPCPVGSREMCGNVFSLVAQLGTQTPVDFYRKLRAEMELKVAAKTGAIPNEKLRLMFDNIPPWYNLELLSYVEQFGAIFVFETYLRYVWGGRINLSDPYRGYAEKLMSDVWLNMSLEQRISTLIRDVRKYKIDGVVFHSNRSCKRFSLGQYELKEALEQELGIPSLIIEADHSNPGGYSESQTKLRVDAFLEVLEERRRC